MESFGSKNNIREDVINAIANEIMKSDFYPALFTSVEVRERQLFRKSY